ncbi:hypothetical protein LguiA_026007 [Lonicera macranthoides]
MVTRDRSRAVYVGFNKGVLTVRLEFKEFRFQMTEHGSMVSITEITKSKSYRIIIDFKVAEWVSRELKKAAGGVESSPFSSKYQLPGLIWLLQRYSNEKGIFMSLLEIKGGTVSREVVIPACKNGEGWLKVAEALLKIIYRPGNMQANNRAVGYYTGKKTEHSTRSSKRNFTVGTRLDEKVSYAEIVKRNNIAPFFEKQSRGRDEGKEAILKSYGTFDWDKVIVCTRESLWHDWASIQEAINRQFKEAIRMQPFQPDKAVIQCRSEESAMKLGRSKRVLFFEGRAVCLQAWGQNEVMFNRKLAFTGGWIEFTDLPLNWWRREVFEKIGSQCGGLITIDKSTVSMSRLFAPRIKVSGNSSGFIPAEIDLVGKGKEKCTIRLKVLSKLNLKNRGKFNKIPELGVFDRCIIGVVEFNGGQGRDQVPNVCEIGDVKNKTINEGMGNIELYRSENESAGLIEGKVILKEGRGKMGEFIGEGNNCGTSINEKEGVTRVAEDMGWEYQRKGKMKEGDRVIKDGGLSHINLLNSGMVAIEGETGFTVEEEGKRDGLDSGSNENVEIEDFLVARSKLKGWRNKSSLFKFKWSAQKPLQFYRRRKKQKKMSLKFNDTGERDLEGEVMTKWEEYFKEKEEREYNNVRELEEELVSGDETIVHSDFEYKQVMIDNRESDGEDSYVDSSSDEEGLKIQNVIDNCDGDNNWLARFFFDGEADLHVGVKNVDSERRYARKEGKQLVLHGLNAGSPADSISYSFGNSNGAIFTIYRGGYGAEIFANKLTMSVFYEKVFRKRNEVDNLVEIQTIMGSKRDDYSKNKMGASSNIIQAEKENVVENGVTNAISAMVEKKDQNSNRRADDQKVLGTIETQLVAAEGWIGLNKKDSEKFDRLLDGMGIKMTQLCQRHGHSLV